jgi:hypothetical protein
MGVSLIALTSEFGRWRAGGSQRKKLDEPHGIDGPALERRGKLAFQIGGNLCYIDGCITIQGLVYPSGLTKRILGLKLGSRLG